MATVSFKPAATPAESTEIVSGPGTTALDCARKLPQCSGLVGDFSYADINVPYLSIVQKTGQVFDAHPEWLGHWLFDKQHSLGNVVQGIPLKMKKLYEADVEFGSNTIPAKFESEAKAKASGLPYVTLAEIDVLIRLPESLAEWAQIDDWAPARYIVRRTAFRACVGTLLKDLAGYLRGNLRSGIYLWRVEKRVSDKNSYYVPSIQTETKTPVELLTRIDDMFAR